MRIALIAILVLGAPVRAQNNTVDGISKEYRTLVEDDSLTARMRRRELAHRLGRLPGKECSKTLLAILKVETWTPARLEAIRSLGAVGDRAALEKVIKGAGRTPSPGFLDAIADALSRSQKPEVRKWMRTKLLKDPRSKLRLSTVVALGRMNDPAAIPFLKQTLASATKHKNPALRCECILALRDDAKVVEQAAGSKDWHDRWAAATVLREHYPEHPLLPGLQEDSRPAVRRAAGRDTSRELCTAFGIPIHGFSVLFMLDISGSMKAGEAPPQPIDIAVKGLKKALNNLNRTARFGVMTFNSDIHQWREQPSPAMAKDCADAIEWIEQRALPRGGTNTYRALMEALHEARGYDAIVLISDDLPTSGEWELPEDVVALVRAENRFATHRIYTVALTFGRPTSTEAKGHIPYGPRTAEFLRVLAEQNGGKTVDVKRPFQLD